MNTDDLSGHAFAERLAPEHTAGYTVELAVSPLDTTIKQLVDVYSALALAQRAVFAAAARAAATSATHRAFREMVGHGCGPRQARPDF